MLFSMKLAFLFSLGVLGWCMISMEALAMELGNSLFLGVLNYFLFGETLGLGYYSFMRTLFSLFKAVEGVSMLW